VIHNRPLLRVFRIEPSLRIGALPFTPAEGGQPMAATVRVLLTLLLVVLFVPAAFGQACNANDPTADVVALDQPFTLNRLGAMVPSGMIYALKRDVVPSNCYDSGGDCTASGAPPFTLTAGQVQLRRDKRPRPLVLRVNEGQCLIITLSNMLPNPPAPAPDVVPPNVPASRAVSIHVQGLELQDNIVDDGSFVGSNNNSLVNPGHSITYKFVAAREGSFLMYSMGANFDQATVGGTFMGSSTNGMFGTVTVEPKGGEYYRSQVTREELLKYATKKSGGNPVFTPVSGGGAGAVVGGQPEIDYQARYPVGHARACAPVLRMVATPQVVSGGVCKPLLGAPPETFYGDLTAIITGPNAGNFTSNGPSFNPISASPDRRQPFREFTIHYHELNNVTQAFNAFDGLPNCPGGPAGQNAGMGGVLTPGSDLFAINYGTGGISAEILANRLGVGPQKDCVDCKFEEFFLSAWTVGDPAEVTDVLANAELSCPGVAPQHPTKVLFPDDPSNVYHSYLNDHVKFRILHAGADLTHVHHQHAHQWLHSPNDNDSTYLDSQMISPGSSYTLEIDYHGSGNRNRTIGDSIFHCHFYPHFAAGMWSMWRVHDVFEEGTQLDGNGVPVLNARATPDGELTRGAPIPGLVPVPTLVMAPLPSYTHLDATGKRAIFGGTCSGNAVDGIPVVGGCTNGQTLEGTATANNQFVKTAKLLNPGYPFFISGIAGSRPPHPPLDFACEEISPGVCKTVLGQPVLLDGGLPRHVIVTGTVADEHHNVWDFTKNNPTFDAVRLPEDGTPEEKAAMKYHGTLNHSSFTPSGVAGLFRTNGLPRGPQHGAPYADPAVHLDGTTAGSRVVRYKAADIQTDVVFNKVGWHYPQQRFITLWQDVQPTLNGGTLAQPFFFRANSNQDIIEYWLANLVPAYYELDDFQVRTPTDILGQHIHLVKFDVLASDGAANGYNYEDGTLSYQEVDDRIHAINAFGGLRDFNSNTRHMLTVKSIPELDPTGTKFPGAQATIQRWYPDPLLGDRGNPAKDRTLRTVFTHDHFGPSTHQQAGLYAGLLVEPENSTWTLQDGTPMKTRTDGGPTSWEGRIINGSESYREFALEFQDLALSYTSASIGTPVCYPGSNPPIPIGCTAYGSAYPPTINASTKVFGWADPSHVINPGTAAGPNPTLKTNPTIISGTVFVGTMNVNYRNEPVPLRVDKGAHTAHDPADPKTDLAFTFASMPRTQSYLNTQPVAGSPIAGGGENAFTFNAPFEGAGPFDPYTPLLRAYQGDPVQVRVLVGGYLFNHNFAFHGVKWRFEPSALDSGWRDNQPMGISEHFEFLFKAPVTQKPASTQPCLKNAAPSLFCADYLYTPGSGQWDLAQGLWGLMRTYNTGGGSAINGLKTLPNNSGGGAGMQAVGCPSGAPQRNYYVKAINDRPLTYNARIAVGNSIINPYPLRYILTDQGGTPLTADKIPLVLRANAGDCVNVTLTNAMSTAAPIFTIRDANIPGFTPLGVNSTSGFYASAQAGLHPQLLTYDVTSNAGFNVGLNPTQTVAPGATQTFHWYAGNVDGVTSTAVEFGSSNLISADPIEHPSLSMVGAFVTEPKASTWPADGPLTADVKSGNNTLFREFVNVLANNVYLYGINALPPSHTAKFFNAINYWSNSMGYRFGGQNGVPPNINPTNSTIISDAFSNTHAVPGSTVEWGDPQPVWVVERGKPFRLRMVHSDGLGGFPDDVMKLHGHVYAEEPYTASSTKIGFNGNTNWMGAREGFGPGHQFDIVIDHAGGGNAVPGDYLFASFPAAEQANGNWALVRVCDSQNILLYPCTTTPVPPQGTGTYAAAPANERPHDLAPPATSPERFLLRTHTTAEPKAEPPINVPANTPPAPAPPSAAPQPPGK
jgi:hypothetical protein